MPDLSPSPFLSLYVYAECLLNEKEYAWGRRREPAAELCYGDLNSGRDLKYVYTPRWKHGNRGIVQKQEPAAIRMRLIPLSLS